MLSVCNPTRYDLYFCLNRVGITRDCIVVPMLDVRGVFGIASVPDMVGMLCIFLHTHNVFWIWLGISPLMSTFHAIWLWSVFAALYE